MTRLSGWCSAPDGAIPMCVGCKVLDCGHSCHNNAQKPTVDRDSASDVLGLAGEIAYPGRTAKRPLGGASTPLIQGASPTNKESTDD